MIVSVLKGECGQSKMGRNRFILPIEAEPEGLSARQKKQYSLLPARI